MSESENNQACRAAATLIDAVVRRDFIEAKAIIGAGNPDRIALMLALAVADEVGAEQLAKVSLWLACDYGAGE